MWFRGSLEGNPLSYSHKKKLMAYQIISQTRTAFNDVDRPFLFLVQAQQIMWSYQYSSNSYSMVCVLCFEQRWKQHEQERNSVNKIIPKAPVACQSRVWRTAV